MGNTAKFKVLSWNSIGLSKITVEVLYFISTFQSTVTVTQTLTKISIAANISAVMYTVLSVSYSGVQRRYMI